VTRGKFIAFEGGEGRGKSTQAAKLAIALQERNIEAELTREPGGTLGAEAIRALLLAPPGDGWNVEAEALLFAAARADHVAKRIWPALADGRWVICDRFLDSSRAYQGVAGAMGDDAIRALHTIGSRNLLPDLTIVLETNDDIADERLRERDGGASDAIGGRERTYHANVNRAFRDFSAGEPDRFAFVSGEGDIDDVHARVMAAIAPLLGNAKGL